jgi:hypothetical protein
LGLPISVKSDISISNTDMDAFLRPTSGNQILKNNQERLPFKKSILANLHTGFSIGQVKSLIFEHINSMSGDSNQNNNLILLNGGNNNYNGFKNSNTINSINSDNLLDSGRTKIKDYDNFSNNTGITDNADISLSEYIDIDNYKRSFSFF